jgi:hypothetical protein
VLDLARAGMPGHSHMLMMDRGSDRVAAAVANWVLRRA